MCKAKDEPGGPKRCVADTRARLNAAALAHKRATDILRKLQAQAVATAGETTPDLDDRIQKAFTDRAHTHRLLQEAQDSYDATAPGLEDLEATYAQAVTDGDTRTQSRVLTRLQRAQDTMNDELAQRRERWGSRREPEAYQSVPIVPRTTAGEPAPDPDTLAFARATGITASARRYTSARHPDGTWNLRLTRTDSQGHRHHLTLVVPDDGHPPTMRTVMEASAQTHGHLTNLPKNLDITELNDDAVNTVTAMDAWTRRAATPPPTITTSDLNDRPDYAAWAMSRGLRPDPQATETMVRHGQQLGRQDNTPFTPTQGEEYARRLATHGVTTNDLDDDGYRSYVMASGNYPSWLAAQTHGRSLVGDPGPAPAPPTPGHPQASPSHEHAAPNTPTSTGGDAHPPHDHAGQTPSEPVSYRLTRSDKAALAFFGVAALMSLAIIRSSPHHKTRR